MSERIEVRIDKDGNVEVQPIGMSGPSCKKATADLERALGKTTADRKTPEFNKQATQKHRGLSAGR